MRVTAAVLCDTNKPWHRLLGRPVSKYGRLCHGDGGHEGGARREDANVAYAPAAMTSSTISWMINPNITFQTQTSLEIPTPVQTRTMVEETSDGLTRSRETGLPTESS